MPWKSAFVFGNFFDKIGQAIIKTKGNCKYFGLTSTEKFIQQNISIKRIEKNTLVKNKSRIELTYLLTYTVNMKRYFVFVKSDLNVFKRFSLSFLSNILHQKFGLVPFFPEFKCGFSS